MTKSLIGIAALASSLALGLPALAGSSSLDAANARLGQVPPGGITQVKDVEIDHFAESRVSAIAIMARGRFTNDDMMNVLKCAVDRFAESKGFDEWALNINNVSGTPTKTKYSTVFSMFKPPYPEDLRLMTEDPCELVPEQAKDSYNPSPDPNSIGTAPAPM